MPILNIRLISLAKHEQYFRQLCENSGNVIQKFDAPNMALPSDCESVCIRYSSPMIEKKPRNMPVIALAPSPMKGDREKTIEAGCDDYISKPIDPEKILAKIEKWAKKG